jgi:hypothetical protein
MRADFRRSERVSVPAFRDGLRPGPLSGVTIVCEVNEGETRWSVRRRDAIEASLFLIAAVACLLAAVWLPPALFDTSQRLVSLRLALLSMTGGAVLGLVLSAISLMRHLRVETMPSWSSGGPTALDTSAT